MSKKSRKKVTGIVGIYREGQSDFVGVVKVGDETFNWYGYNTIPNCIKDVCNNSDVGSTNYANVVITINEDGSYPKINEVVSYINK